MYVPLSIAIKCHENCPMREMCLRDSKKKYADLTKDVKIQTSLINSPVVKFNYATIIGLVSLLLILFAFLYPCPKLFLIQRP